HAPGPLAPELFGGLHLEVPVVVAHPPTRVALVEADPMDLQKGTELTHQESAEATNAPGSSRMVRFHAGRGLSRTPDPGQRAVFAAGRRRVRLRPQRGPPSDVRRRPAPRLRT